jgi:hypothetical protein
MMRIWEIKDLQGICFEFFAISASLCQGGEDLSAAFETNISSFLAVL